MTWKPEADELKQRHAYAEALGGAEAVKRHHEQMRLTVRERIAGLVDAD
jgi:acetyl-CoA carboxylase carboxyltransferase component